MTRTLAVAALFGLALAACSNRPPIPAPARFDRLNRTDFACLDTQKLGVVPLDYCQVCLTPPTLHHENCNVDASDTHFEMFALVTQSARGEVAAINLVSRAVIDSRRDIPGFTYFPIGESPSGIAIPQGKRDERDPKYHMVSANSVQWERLSYVSDFGSHDLRVLNTTSLVQPPTGPVSPAIDLSIDTGLGDQTVGGVDTRPQLWPPADSVELQVVPLAIDTPDGRVPVSPTELKLTPTEDALLVGVRDLGKVLYIPLINCMPESESCHSGLIDVSKMVVIDLAGSVDKIEPVTLPSEPRPVYEQLCNVHRPNPPPPVAVDVPASMLNFAPRPSAFAFDTDCDLASDPSCKPRLLVADEALPIIHAIDLDALAAGSDGQGALLAPIVTGVPTLDVVATPRVPVTNDPTKAADTTRYVYAIDATDGSVLVTENGVVLRPSPYPGGRIDRLTLGGAGTTQQSAVRLEVLTPTVGDKHPLYVSGATVTATLDDDSCMDATFTAEDPARLRGVFLAVAMSDGSVRIIDIHDRELSPDIDPKTNLKSTQACRQCPTDPSVPVLVRHETRLLANFIEAQGAAEAQTLTPIPNPIQYDLATALYAYGIDGSIGTPNAPPLCHFDCDKDLVQTFPTADEEMTASVGATEADEPGCRQADPSTASNALPKALVCGMADAWGAADEYWTAQYNGLIPDTITGGTRLVEPGDPDSIDGAAPQLVADGVDFCSRGVLGQDDIGDDYPSCAGGAGASDKPSGDQVVVTDAIVGQWLLTQLGKKGSTPPSPVQGLLTKNQIARCKTAADAMTADTSLRIGFEIQRAYRDRLVLSLNPKTHRAEIATPIDSLRTLDDVRACLGGKSWNIEVHTLNSFAVVGNQSGFLHRVHAAADGRCVVDASADPLMRGRTRAGCPFRNHTLQFEFRKQIGGDQLTNFGQLELSNTNPAVKLALSGSHAGFSTATVVPAQLRYNEYDRRLYLVDISDRGLVPIPLNPLPASIDVSSVYN